MKNPKIDVQDIAAIGSAAAAVQVAVRQAEERTEIAKKSTELRDLILKKKDEVLKKERVAENTYAESTVKIEVVREELSKAQQTKNKIDLEVCTNELRLLQLRATQNKAVLDYQLSKIII